MKIIDSWVEPGNLHARRGVRMFHVRVKESGEMVERYFTGQELARKVGKNWKSIYEQGRRHGWTNPEILKSGCWWTR